MPARVHAVAVQPYCTAALILGETQHRGTSSAVQGGSVCIPKSLMHESSIVRAQVRVPKWLERRSPEVALIAARGVRSHALIEGPNSESLARFPLSFAYRSGRTSPAGL